jgi:Scaffold domain
MIPLRRFRFAPVLLAALLAAIATARSQGLTPTGAAALHAIADSARNPDLRWPDFTPEKMEFSNFYQANGYSLAWIQGQRATPQALAVIGLLKSSGSKGLDAEDYQRRSVHANACGKKREALPLLHLTNRRSEQRRPARDHSVPCSRIGAFGHVPDAPVTADSGEMYRGNEQQSHESCSDGTSPGSRGAVAEIGYLETA